jgi:Capsule assembly protein Wzi
MTRCRNMRREVLALCAVLALIAIAAPANAGPWADVGDAQLRSDVEVLAATGLVDSVTTQWPIPWGGLLSRLGEMADFDGGPGYVREAAERIETEAQLATQTGQMTFGVTSDFTNLPDVVRGFDALGRENLQGQAWAEWLGDTTVVRLQVGAQSTNRYDHQALMFDGSYIAQRIGNAAVYGGYMTHWWGPGWDTALSLSNNARPFPQIGITRLDTTPFSSPWLSWIGPWQAEFFVGVLDGQRLARNTLFNGLRVSASPVPGLEIALARTEQSCGTNQAPTSSFDGIHPCHFVSEFFNVYNDETHVSSSKDETNFDLRYTDTIGSYAYAVYMQVMDRDTGPFVHSDSSHLFGASLWVPVRNTAIRFTAEYADTISTKNFFSFGEDFYNITYTDYKYTDGWQYRGRTLGSSLDTDSRLASLHASWAAPHDLTYTLTYYRASIGSPQGVDGINRVSSTPVTINIGEARLHIPFARLSLDLAARLQSDQPRPDHGFAAAGELAFSYRL